MAEKVIAWLSWGVFAPVRDGERWRLTASPVDGRWSDRVVLNVLGDSKGEVEEAWTELRLLLNGPDADQRIKDSIQ